MLTRIAETTGGLYVPLGSMGEGFATIYEQKLALVPKEEHEQRMRKIPIERFSWPIGIAIALLAVEFLLSSAKPSWSLRLPFKKTAGRRKKDRTVAGALLCVLALSEPAVTLASPGEEHFAAGAYDQAEQYYRGELTKKPEDSTLHFNLGDVLYKQNNFEEAAAFFTHALQSDDLGLQAKSYYNLGNTQYRIGSSRLKTDPRQTIQVWEKSLQSFAGSLQLNPEDENARFNRDLVKKQQDALKQQQQNNQQQNQEEKQDQQPDDNLQKNQDKQQKNPAAEDEGEQKKENEGQQPDEQQQPADNENADKKENDQGSALQSGEPGENQQQTEPTGESSVMNNQDRERRQEGKMTAAEARSLLEALKNEEGKLNFIPQGGNGQQKEPVRDW